MSKFGVSRDSIGDDMTTKIGIFLPVGSILATETSLLNTTSPLKQGNPHIFLCFVKAEIEQDVSSRGQFGGTVKPSGGVPPIQRLGERGPLVQVHLHLIPRVNDDFESPGPS